MGNSTVKATQTLVVTLAMLLGTLALAPKLHAQTAQPSSDELAGIARDTYVYAYPLLLQELTRQQVTNAIEPKFPQAPTNQLAHAPAFPPADMK